MATSKTFSFAKIPANVEELKAIHEASMTDEFAVCALTLLVLCNYENNVDETIKMINFLKGPQELSAFDKQFLKDRLVGKYYVPFSYFEGATPDNGYKADEPYKITVSDNPYSYQDENYANLYITSSGADSPRSIKMRKKPSEGKWFMWENFALADIRIPKAADPWA